jgi:hypothetical protein
VVGIAGSAVVAFALAYTTLRGAHSNGAAVTSNQ